MGTHKKEKAATKEQKVKKEKRDKKNKKENKEALAEKASSEIVESSNKRDDAKERNAEKDSLEYDDAEIKDVVSSVRSTVQSQGEQVSVQSVLDEVRDQQLAKGFDHKLRLYIVLEG